MGVDPRRTVGGIWAERLSKSYSTRSRGGLARISSRVTVLKGVDLCVTPGEIYGLVGANGAGKTTLMKILSGILQPDSGLAYVNGYSVVHKKQFVKATSSLLKSGGWTGLLYQLSVLDNLKTYGRLSGIKEDLIRERAESMLDLTRLREKAAELPWYLSAGQRQKLCLAMMGMVITPVVFLDEPTVHLDPSVANDVRIFIRDVMNRARGQTILLSTHYLDEAEALCSRVGILDSGSMLAEGSLDDLRRTSCLGEIVQLRLKGASEEFLSSLAGLPDVERVRVAVEDPVSDVVRVHLEPRPQATGVLRKINQLCEQEEGIDLLMVRTSPPTLRDVYLELLAGRRQ